MKEPNIFRALSIERKEIRHSNFISYILNPNENHGLRDIVLKKILRDIFSDEKSDQRSLVDVDYLNLNTVEIRREWRNIDILIILDSDIIIIENKVDSVDHSNQLKRYKHIVDEAFKGKIKHYVYLTPFGNDPSDSESGEIYINYSYVQIAEILDSIIKLYRNNISEKIFIYLKDYLTTIKRELLMNDEMNGIALKVYNAHKDAFDFIFNNMPDPSSILYPYFETELNNAGYVIGSKNKGYIRFTTKEFESKLPKAGQGWTDKEVFLFEIEYFWSDKYATVNAVIAPCDESIRSTILDAVKKSRFYKEPSGTKWFVFYKIKEKFTASEMINKDETEIITRIKSIIDNIKPAVDEFNKLIIEHYWN